ncbi:NAD dependent epimerase/dehydratase [Colletotrichum sojae]|uniref:NAD dependent epimerase/dehydratase n=1 Tax=Colletotrichum sojae TaxID=2175907 RepID=A0A8H6MIT2_9PEZI|nr:NAD dependent epimerase/dehydratase [Colletotrichum sojae]
MNTSRTIVSKDIYHGLPTFPNDLTDLTAVVCGANGISGVHMLADQLKKSNIKPDYVFFFAYIQPKPEVEGQIWSAVDELVKVNTELLNNFLQALVLANALPKTFLLQLGAKYYGVHNGPTATPQEESDPRVLLEPNFYYHQEDSLKEFARENGFNWITTRPSWIPGAAQDAAMNLCLPLGIYAAVQKSMGRALEYPADLTAWETQQAMSSAQMNGHLSEWCVLTPGAQNESFNASDDCAFTWSKFWPRLAAKFYIPWKGPDVDNEGSGFREVSTPYNPPPRGYGPPGVLRFKFTLVEWAKRPEVQKEWKKLASDHGLRNQDLWDVERVFGFADAGLQQSWPNNYSSVAAPPVKTNVRGI